MQGQMPHQMPQVGGMMQPPMMPKQVMGMGNDCGCGGTMGQQMGREMYQMYPYPGQQMGYFPQGFINPYGPGTMGGYAMPGYEEESNEY